MQQAVRAACDGPLITRKPAVLRSGFALQGYVPHIPDRHQLVGVPCRVSPFLAGICGELAKSGLKSAFPQGENAFPHTSIRRFSALCRTGLWQTACQRLLRIVLPPASTPMCTVLEKGRVLYLRRAGGYFSFVEYLDVLVCRRLLVSSRRSQAPASHNYATLPNENPASFLLVVTGVTFPAIFQTDWRKPAAQRGRKCRQMEPAPGCKETCHVH